MRGDGDPGKGVPGGVFADFLGEPSGKDFPACLDPGEMKSRREPFQIIPGFGRRLRIDFIDILRRKDVLIPPGQMKGLHGANEHHFFDLAAPDERLQMREDALGVLRTVQRDPNFTVHLFPSPSGREKAGVIGIYEMPDGNRTKPFDTLYILSSLIWAQRGKSSGEVRIFVRKEPYFSDLTARGAFRQGGKPAATPPIFL